MVGIVPWDPRKPRSSEFFFSLVAVDLPINVSALAQDYVTRGNKDNNAIEMCYVVVVEAACCAHLVFGFYHDGFMMTLAFVAASAVVTSVSQA